jgi:hypothetical protein
LNENSCCSPPKITNFKRTGLNVLSPSPDHHPLLFFEPTFSNSLQEFELLALMNFDRWTMQQSKENKILK